MKGLDNFLTIVGFYMDEAKKAINLGETKEGFVKHMMSYEPKLREEFLNEIYDSVLANGKWQILWYESGEFLYKDNQEFSSKEEAIDYAEEHFGDQLEFQGRPIYQKELDYEVKFNEKSLTEDAISGQGYNRAKEKENSDDYEEEDFIEITNEELEALEKKEEIEKYFDNDTMVALPPKELFKEFCLNKAHDTDEIKFKYNGYNCSIEIFTYSGDGYTLNVNGKRFYSLTLDSLYETLQNIDEKYESMLSEEEKSERMLEKVRKSILESINNINANTDLKTLVKIENDIDFYSDVYKDINNFRPRWETGEFNRLIKSKNPKLFQELQDLPHEEYVKLLNE